MNPFNVTLAKRFTFDAAHRLDRLPPDHKCYRLHGHTYEVEIVLRGPVDPSTGFLVDYERISMAWKSVHDQLDHRFLNEVPGLEVSSTENLAAWILVLIGASLVHVHAVRVKESSSTWCEVLASDLKWAGHG